MIWYKLEKKKPIATEKGCWDGLRSDKILVATRDRKLHVVQMYEGVLDGCEFCDFYDENDWLIKDVIFWTEIESPF
jgi:hypothetical protein